MRGNAVVEAYRCLCFGRATEVCLDHYEKGGGRLLMK